MKQLIFLFSLLIGGATTKEVSNTPGFDQVIAYQLPYPDEESGLPQRILDINGQINSMGQSYALTRDQINKFLTIINDPFTYGAAHSFSHYPEIGLVFYKNGKIVDWIEVAFQTNGLGSKKRIKAEYTYYDTRTGPDLKYELTGLSPEGRKKLRGCLTKIGFPEQVFKYNQWDSIQVNHSSLKRLK